MPLGEAKRLRAARRAAAAAELLRGEAIMMMPQNDSTGEAPPLVKAGCLS